MKDSPSTYEMKEQFDKLPTEELAAWVAAYANSSISPYIRAKLFSAAQRLRELDGPGFGGK